MLWLLRWSSVEKSDEWIDQKNAKGIIFCTQRRQSGNKIKKKHTHRTTREIREKKSILSEWEREKGKRWRSLRPFAYTPKSSTEDWKIFDLCFVFGLPIIYSWLCQDSQSVCPPKIVGILPIHPSVSVGLSVEWKRKVLVKSLLLALCVCIYGWFVCVCVLVSELRVWVTSLRLLSVVVLPVVASGRFRDMALLTIQRSSSAGTAAPPTSSQTQPQQQQQQPSSTTSSSDTNSPGGGSLTETTQTAGATITITTDSASPQAAPSASKSVSGIKSQSTLSS